MGDKKKTCFVITPIGEDNSEIRRHIDGIIDQSIIPAIGAKYDISVSHRDYEIGSINDKIVKSVYESDLVIANLTNTNPNVMFELAIRYSFGKPAIVIAEDGTKLPFDISGENTIFYINDPAGANELKDIICETEKKIEFSRKDYGPVYKVINSIPLYNEVESGAATGEDVPSEKLLQYIIDRLDIIEKNMSVPSRWNVKITAPAICFIVFHINMENTSVAHSILEQIRQLKGVYENVGIDITQKVGFEGFWIGVVIKGAVSNVTGLRNKIEERTKKNGIPCHCTDVIQI